MKALFVTGTGTSIGKTFVTAGLLAALRTHGVVARAIKPVVSGYDPAEATTSDPGRLLLAMGRMPAPDAVAQISPFRFAAPVSPDMAARLERRDLRVADIVAFCRQSIADANGQLLIEGVGGLMSPIAEDATVLDLIRALDLPVLLIGGTYLGAISHALTSVSALNAANLEMRALLINESPVGSVGPGPTRESIARFLPSIRIAELAQGAGPDAFFSLAQACGLLPVAL